MRSLLLYNFLQHWLAVSYRSSGTACESHLQASWTAWPPRMGLTGCPKTSVTNCQLKAGKIPEGQWPRDKTSFVRRNGINIAWDVIPSTAVNRYKHLNRACCLQLTRSSMPENGGSRLLWSICTSPLNNTSLSHKTVTVQSLLSRSQIYKMWLTCCK